MNDEQTRLPELQIVVFEVGKAAYGLGLDSVREIVSGQQVSILSNAPRFVSGAVVVDRVVVPVLDLCERLSIDGEAVESPEQRILVVESSRCVVGLLVDAVTDVVRVPESDFAPPNELAKHSEHVSGIAKVDQRNILLLDVEKTLSPDEARQLTMLVRERDSAA